MIPKHLWWNTKDHRMSSSCIPWQMTWNPMLQSDCVEKLFSIVDTAISKWPMAKIIISGTTPRGDNVKHNSNCRIINALLQQRVDEAEGPIHYVDHGNMTANGNPIPDLLAEDKYHLSTKGASLLAKSLKWKIHSILGITAAQSQWKPRGRSRSRFRRY